MNDQNIAIIGAGISGLFLGKTLLKNAKNYAIFEKSRGIGGRLATRRINDLGFDHGAAYLCDCETLQMLLSEVNLNAFMTSQGVFYNGGMNQLAKHLAANQPIKKEMRAMSFSQSGNRWITKFENGEHFISDTIVLTAPLPQALELLEKSDITFNPSLRTMSYRMALQALVITRSNILETPFHRELQSILRLKERGLHPEGFVLSASAEFSAIHFEKSDEEILKNFQDLYTELDHIELKKWRYSTPKSALKEAYLEIAPNFFLIGDAFLYPDIRGALGSAEALAQKLI